jgi:hypothetical protein
VEWGIASNKEKTDKKTSHFVEPRMTLSLLKLGSKPVIYSILILILRKFSKTVP